MYLSKKHKTIVLLFLFLAALLSGSTTISSYLPKEMQALLSPTRELTVATPPPTVASSSAITVSRVIDGDTIEISTGQKVRYIGIDTPEAVDPRRAVECFGKDASEKNKALVLHKEVTLEKDINETDRFGRLLRYVYVEGVMINEQLVREGYAQSSAYPPDVKYQTILDQAEKEAQAKNVGLWSVCQR